MPWITNVATLYTWPGCGWCCGCCSCCCCSCCSLSCCWRCGCWNCGWWRRCSFSPPLTTVLRSMMSVGVMADGSTRGEGLQGRNSIGLKNCPRVKLKSIICFKSWQHSLERMVCEKGFVKCFLKQKVSLVCLGSRAAAVQPTGL